MKLWKATMSSLLATFVNVCCMYYLNVHLFQLRLKNEWTTNVERLKLRIRRFPLSMHCTPYSYTYHWKLSILFKSVKVQSKVKLLKLTFVCINAFHSLLNSILPSHFLSHYNNIRLKYQLYLHQIVHSINHVFILEFTKGWLINEIMGKKSIFLRANKYQKSDY